MVPGENASSRDVNKKKRVLPKNRDEWLREIKVAYEDGRKTKPFALLTGQWLTNAKLFHLAPLICMKFRGLDVRDEKLRKRVIEGALANYVANTESQGLDANPKLAFAVCYVAAHYVLDLLDEQQAEEVLCYCEEHFSE